MSASSKPSSARRSSGPGRLGAGPGDGAVGDRRRLDDLRGRRAQPSRAPAFGYTKVLGYHPILATRADTGEVLHARMRKGSANTQRGARRFIDELVARVRRAGATGEIVDAGRFGVLVQRHDRHARAARRALHDGRAHQHQRPSPRRSPAIDEDAWVDIDYTPDGQAQVAECDLHHRHGAAVTRRLIVRRTRSPTAPSNGCGPTGATTPSSPTSTATPSTVDAFHRHHAVVELAIRDLKEGAGLEHVPSGNFHANSAWLQCAVLAHNLIRWTAILGDIRVEDQLTVARTIRTRLIAIPGRLVNRSGRHRAAPPHELAMGRIVTTTAAQHPPTRCARRPLEPARRGQAHRTPPPAPTTRTPSPRHLLQRAR